MSPDAESDLGHAYDAAGWALGALTPGDALTFQEHLPGCESCQEAVADFQRVARVLKRPSPALELPPQLEERTITAVLQAAAAAGQPPSKAGQQKGQATGKAGQQSGQATSEADLQAEATSEAELQGEATGKTVQQGGQKKRETDQQSGEETGKVIRWPRADWRGRLITAGVAVAAAAIAVAVVVPLSRGGVGASGPVAAQFALQPVTATGTAEGQATVYREASGFKIVLNLHGLPRTRAGQYYGCWYVGPRNSAGQAGLITAGSFTVGRSGTADTTMWSAANPAKFQTMEITIDRDTGATPGRQILAGHAAP